MSPTPTNAHGTNDRRNGDASIFPSAGQVIARGTFSDVRTEPSVGLTKRELFAAMAMQGSLGGTPGSHLIPPNLAKLSVQYADALLAALKETP